MLFLGRTDGSILVVIFAIAKSDKEGLKNDNNVCYCLSILTSRLDPSIVYDKKDLTNFCGFETI